MGVVRSWDAHSAHRAARLPAAYAHDEPRPEELHWRQRRPHAVSTRPEVKPYAAPLSDAPLPPARQQPKTKWSSQEEAALVTGVKKCVTCADTSVLDHALCKRPNYLFGRVPLSRAPLTRVPRPGSASASGDSFRRTRSWAIYCGCAAMSTSRYESAFCLAFVIRHFHQSSCSLTLSRHRTNGGICTLRAVAPRRSSSRLRGALSKSQNAQRRHQPDHTRCVT
jgi:hypothetical protein